MSARYKQDITESYVSKIEGLGWFYHHQFLTAESQRIKSLRTAKVTTWLYQVVMYVIHGQDTEETFNSATCEIWGE